MKRFDKLAEARQISIALLLIFGVFVQGVYGISLTVSGSGNGGSSSVATDFNVANAATVNGQVKISGADVMPSTTISGSVSNFAQTHTVSDSTGKSASVSVNVVNAPNGLTYTSNVLPGEGNVAAQPWVSAEQWLTVPTANSISCTASASYGSTTTSVSLDKATSVNGYYGKAYASATTVSATETAGGVTGPFVGTAKVGTTTKTRTPNYGSRYDLTMTAIKGSAPTGTIGYYIDPTLKIQGAVDAAQSGDAINVAAGTYKENVNIDKSLAIKGVGSTKTIVDGNKAGSVFNIGKNNANVDVTLSGMTIMNGLADYGGGIWNRGRLTVTDSTILGNTANKGGGGIYNYYGTLNLVGDTISSNKATASTGVPYSLGGGVYNVGSNATLQNTDVDHNYADNGGGLYNGRTMNIKDGCSINNNTARFNGGGIYTDGVTLNLNGGSIDHNTAMYGGGIWVGGTVNQNGGNVVFNHVITGTDPRQPAVHGGYGGGVFVDCINAVYNLKGGTIANNIADYGGGGLYVSGILNQNGGSISNNQAVYGGGVWSDAQGRVHLSGGSIDHNIATKYGGGIDSNGVLTINGTASISHNIALGTYGGGIVSSGAISFDGPNIVIGANEAHAPNSEVKWYQGWGVYLTSGTPITTGGFNPAKQVTGNTKI